jgi:hypothetical protein
MAEWLLLAALFYALSFYARSLLPGLSEDKLHQLETLSWKVGNAIFGAFLGYWADRKFFGRIRKDSSDLRRIGRALVVIAFILGISSGI